MSCREGFCVSISSTKMCKCQRYFTTTTVNKYGRRSIYTSMLPGRSISHLVTASDDTLIQNGDRFDAGDVYFAIHGMEEIQDYICVGQTRYDGLNRAVLFVKMKDGYIFTPGFKEKIARRIIDGLWAASVPQVILETKDIPYNLNNKRMESLVRKILVTNEIPEVNNISNPNCLQYFCNIPEIINFMKH